MKIKFQSAKHAIIWLFCGSMVWLCPNTIMSQTFHGGVKPPVFSGGKEALKEFIYKNLVIPDSIRETGISGTVMVGIIVKSDGTSGKVNLVRGINPVCDSEALRVAGLIKDWEPALNWGNPVDCKILLPIDFISEKNIVNGPVVVSGIVSNISTGQPIEGTLVIIKGTDSGTLTDKNGSYRLEISAGHNELEFSSMGYESKTVQVDKNRTINVELNNGYYLISLN